MKRLETARAQKDVTEATKVIKQQELHKSLRVRWWIETFSVHRMVLTSALSNQDNKKTAIKCCNFSLGFKKIEIGGYQQHVFPFPFRISTTFAVKLVILDRSASATSAQTPKCWPQPPGTKPAPLALAKVERWRFSCQSVEHKLSYMLVFWWRWCEHAIAALYRSGLCKLWSVPDCSLIRTLRGGSFSSQPQCFMYYLIGFDDQSTIFVHRCF